MAEEPEKTGEWCHKDGEWHYKCYVHGVTVPEEDWSDGGCPLCITRNPHEDMVPEEMPLRTRQKYCDIHEMFMVRDVNGTAVCPFCIAEVDRESECDCFICRFKRRFL